MRERARTSPTRPAGDPGDDVARRVARDSAAPRARFVASRYLAAQARMQSARTRAQTRPGRRMLLRIRLPHDPGSGAVARRLLEAELREVPDTGLGDVKTVVTELVNNACVHGEGPIQLSVRRQDGRLRVDVVDQREAMANARDEPAAGEQLAIVERIALRCGVRTGVAHAWAELALP